MKNTESQRWSNNYVCSRLSYLQIFADDNGTGYLQTHAEDNGMGVFEWIIVRPYEMKMKDKLFR